VDKTLKVWDLESWAEEKTRHGHTHAVLSVAITPDGHRAVSASDDHTVKVWNLESGVCVTTYPAGTSVTAVAIYGTNRIICGAADGQVHFLTLKN